MKMQFKGYTTEMLTEFICNNYSVLGHGQIVYTCTCALQFLFNTGRLNGTQYNFIKDIPALKLYKLIVKIAMKKENEMFTYSQNHFENEWQIFIHKSLN